MSKRTFTQQELLDILWKEDEDSKVLLNEPTSKSRWSINYRLVFEKDGNLYETSYSEGATEIQDEGPWEYQTEIECVEVVAFDKVVIDYKPVEDGE